MNESSDLIVLTSLRGHAFPDGRVRLTGKFLEGMRQYARSWPGKVKAILHPDDQVQSGNLDDVVLHPNDIEFGAQVIPFDSPQLLAALSGARVVQGGPDHLLNHVPEYCRRNGIAHVFVAEYSLRTRLQIIDAETTNPILRLRRYVWAWNQERRNRAGVVQSAAVQCNGTPTFDAYRPLNSRTLLFFDSRVSEQMVAEQPAVARRVGALSQGGPIRLAFSGRLNKMKGADHLLSVASSLRSMRVPFTLDICGDGPLTETLKQRIQAEDLAANVRMRGVLDFEKELMPFIRDEIDLFVCCHRQGDPSCTYLETFACGVPIAGYANEAFAGLLKHCDAGWSSPMDKPELLAQLIATVYKEPNRLVNAAHTAIAFAQAHTADRTFAKRIEQMVQAGEGLRASSAAA